MHTARLERSLEWTLLILLAASHVLAQVLVKRCAAQWPSNLLETFDEALFVSQIGLLAGWSFLGPPRPRWWLRTPCAMALGLFLILYQPWPVGLLTEKLFLTQIIALVSCPIVLRISGWSIVRLAQVEGAQGMRYSLRTLLLLIVAVAVAVRSGQFARAHFATQEILGEWAGPVSIGASEAVVLAASMWVTLAPGNPLWRIPVLIIAPALGWLTPYLLARDAEQHVVQWLSFQAVILVASLFVVRLAGYRWTRHIKRVEPDAPQPVAVASP